MQSSNFRSSVGKTFPDWFGVALLRCYWSEKLAPLYQPIGFKSEPSLDLVSRVFPRSKLFAWLYFESSLVPCDIFVSFDWDRMAFTFAYGPPADHKQASINVFMQFNRGVIRHFELSCCSFAPRFPVLRPLFPVPRSPFPVPRSPFPVPRSKFQKHLFCSYITPREGSISSDLPCRQKERLKLLETTQITTWKSRNSSAIWAVVLVTGTAKGLVLEK